MDQQYTTSILWSNGQRHTRKLTQKEKGEFSAKKSHGGRRYHRNFYCRSLGARLREEISLLDGDGYLISEEPDLSLRDGGFSAINHTTSAIKSRGGLPRVEQEGA